MSSLPNSQKKKIIKSKQSDDNYHHIGSIKSPYWKFRNTNDNMSRFLVVFFISKSSRINDETMKESSSYQQYISSIE